MSRKLVPGCLVISLDFELYWGVRDHSSLNDYHANLIGVRQAIPALLELFTKYEIHATWATVGFLFFGTRNELLFGLPDKKPKYYNRSYCPYSYLKNIGKDESGDPFHYGASLIKKIISYPHQEVGSHTFSHYYVLENGQDIVTFKADMEAAQAIARKYNLTIESVVFPRNQINNKYLSVLREHGIKSYRGNERSYLYKEIPGREETLVRRGLRWLDAYIAISGDNTYTWNELAGGFPLNIPSSRFLRPYSYWLKILDPLRLRRIVAPMTRAARDGRIFHMWWHPHNFGKNLKESLNFLEQVFLNYTRLRERYGMVSLNMGEIASKITEEVH